jgi:hypothetical protein
MALGLAAVGCGPKEPGRPRPARPVVVQVTNQNRSDINLYVSRSGNRARVGTVVAGNQRRFTLRNLPGEGSLRLVFEVQRIGAPGNFSLPEVSVRPGQEVVIQVQDLVSTSSISLLGEEEEEEATPAKRLP